MSVIAVFIRNKAKTPASVVQRQLFCIDFLQVTVHEQHVVQKNKIL